MNQRCRRQHFPKGILWNTRPKEEYISGNTGIKEMCGKLAHTKLNCLFPFLCWAFQNRYYSSCFGPDLVRPKTENAFGLLGDSHRTFCARPSETVGNSDIDFPQLVSFPGDFTFTLAGGSIVLGNDSKPSPQILLSYTPCFCELDQVSAPPDAQM